MPLLPLKSLRFDNTYAQLPEAFYQLVFPTPLRDPRLIAFSPEAARLIDLDPEEAARPDFVLQLTGHHPLPGSWPLAQVYAGHQFGSYVPQLGDGRAILLGEACAEKSHLWNRYRHLAGRKWDVQLKGSGPTRFSRGFDGRAVLRSCIREFLASEAMEAFGIPTSRALAVIGSSEPVFRETPEPGAMLVRLAPCHIRFGSFEYFYFNKQYPQLKELADFTIHQYFPEQEQSETPYSNWLKEVVTRTAELIAHWQAFGFIHGVMNTDNFSILGITLDYGPYGFMENFNPGHVSNHSDPGGLYAFENQPRVGFFNLQCLVRALSPLLTREQAEAALEEYEPALARCYLGLMADKLGLLKRLDGDDALVEELLQALPGHDYTLFFRDLAGLRMDGSDSVAELGTPPRSADARSIIAWRERYRHRLQQEGSQDAERQTHMNRVNPGVIVRNHLAQQSIDAAMQGDNRELERFRHRLMRPYDEVDGADPYAQPALAGSKPLVISCSS